MDCKGVKAFGPIFLNAGMDDTFSVRSRLKPWNESSLSFVIGLLLMLSSSRKMARCNSYGTALN